MTMIDVQEKAPGDAELPLIPSARTILLDLDCDSPPRLDEIETMCREGLTAARLKGAPLGTGAGQRTAEDFLRWLACLRNLTACAVAPDWQAGPGIAGLAMLLRHIAPPRADGSREIEDWGRHHRYGICFWRGGPGFATIVDRRDESRAHQYVLDTPEYLNVFASAQDVVRREMLASISGEALRDLEENALILSVGEWSVALPFRMRHWPVPFTAI